MTKKALSAGQKALIDNTDRLATGAVNKAIDKIADRGYNCKTTSQGSDQQSWLLNQYLIRI